MVERFETTELERSVVRSTVQSELIECDGDGTESGVSPEYASIAALPATASVEEEATQQIAVTATDDYGRTQVVTEDCQYSSADEETATVDNGGLVTGVAAGGPINITVKFGELADTVAITVTAP